MPYDRNHMIGRVDRYVIRGGKEGYDRLQVLARARWPDTRDLLERVGVRSGARCLDLGCGGGEVTFELARLVGTDGHVTGVDMDEVKLALGRASAVEQGLANVEFRAANVNDWSEASAYDLVYCRLLLEHLSQPVELVRRKWLAVNPGGTIVVEDADFDELFCEPQTTASTSTYTSIPACSNATAAMPLRGASCTDTSSKPGSLAPLSDWCRAPLAAARQKPFRYPRSKQQPM